MSEVRKAESSSVRGAATARLRSPGAPASAAAPTVLAAKLRPPVTSTHLARLRLHALLDESVAAPLTLVVAPAGSGKTAMLSMWVGQSDASYSWLALDETDRDPVQLWCGLLAALEQLAPGCSAAGARLRRPGEMLAGVGDLLDDLEQRDCPEQVLVVDDLHLVDDAEDAIASLGLFVLHLPSWLHVVLAGRRVPRLPIDRLRARGQLAEVRFPELRFSFEEAAAMLVRLAPTLEPDAVTAIATEAGGWAARIQFAAIAARSARGRGADGLPVPDTELHLLEDYVWHEVLGNESEDIVDVLLATSVVQHLDAGLAQILTERPDAADLLALAEQRGLFVTRTDPSGEYEVHALVRDLLLKVLSKRSPERLERLHSWAAGWFQAHGQTMLALDHWLRADRPREALRLLAAEAAALYDAGHQSTIERVVAALPDALVEQGLEARLEFAWCHLLIDRRRFVALVDDLVRWARGELDLAPHLLARVEVLQSMAATARGDWGNSSSLARSALQQLGHEWWLDPLGRFAWNMVGREVALSERWDEGADDTKEVLRTLAIIPERRFALEGTRALGEALAGRPVDALRLAAGARDGSEVANMRVLRLELLTAQAIARREIGETAEALHLLREVLADEAAPTVYCQVLAWLELVQARLAEGMLDEANDFFGHAAELVDTEFAGPGGKDWLARTGTVLALGAGEFAEARAWVARTRDPFWWAVGAARVALADDEPGAAYDALKAAEPRCVRHRVVAGLLQFRATESPAEAGVELAGAVRLAADHGLVQTVAAEGQVVLEAVERLAWRAPEGWLGRVRRAAAPSGGRHGPGLDLVEPLTDRELEVLRMLPSRLTLREVADELCISPNTLKFHLKVIYRKLGCASRAEAAEMARSLLSLRRPAQSSALTRR